jgi:non-ribosomal peptide synthase protein (TIGR01720 family)
VKEQLRRIPRKGIGYGLLRYGNPRVSAELEAFEGPLLSFNYLGQLDSAFAEEGFFRPAPERIGPARSPRGERRHLIDVTAIATGGRLRVEWMYAGRLLEPRSLQVLSEAYIDFLRALTTFEDVQDEPGISSYSPSDFPLLDLDRGKLEKLLAKRLHRKD